MLDIFGGKVDVPDDVRRKGGHYWVGIGTKVEHCTSCRSGPTDAPCLGSASTLCGRCGHHMDEHQGDQSRSGACGTGRHRTPAPVPCDCPGFVRP